MVINLEHEYDELLVEFNNSNYFESMCIFFDDKFIFWLIRILEKNRSLTKLMGKNTIDINDVHMAIQMAKEREYPTSPPLDVI